MPDPFPPELRLARCLPRAAVTRWTLPVFRALAPVLTALAPGEVVPVADGVTVRVSRPRGTPRGGLLWIHGGGLIVGFAAQDDALCRRYADALGLLVASVDYRLAPEHPYPTPLHDCYAALGWLAAQLPGAPLAVGGASAGGGLAAAVAQLARERGGPALCLQLLRYPMLDDRTAARTDVDEANLRMWNQAANRRGWASYLGSYGGPDVPAGAVPARCADLRGLPPAWIGVGTNDLFHDECLDYARRLAEAGVPVQTTVEPGGYHAFDEVEAWSAPARRFRAAELAALAAGMGSANDAPPG